MSAIPELKWTEHHQGAGRQMWNAESESGPYKVMQLECKNEHGNEWQLLFPDNTSLYFQTVDEAKDKATRDSLRNFGIRDIEFKAETLATGAERKYEARGRFICPLDATTHPDPNLQLRAALALEPGKPSLVGPTKTNDGFFRSLSDREQVAVLSDLKIKAYWLHID